MRFKALIVAAAAMFAQPAFAAGYGEFTGNWRNDNPSTNDITRLRINVGGGGLKVRAWGQCHPVDCDWGTVSSVEYSYSPAANPASSATDVVATFNPGFAQKILILTDRPGDRLSYAIFTRYTDGSGRRPFVTRGTMRKHVRRLAWMAAGWWRLAGRTMVAGRSGRWPDGPVMVRAMRWTWWAWRPRRPRRRSELRRRLHQLQLEQCPVAVCQRRVEGRRRQSLDAFVRAAGSRSKPRRADHPALSLQPALLHRASECVDGLLEAGRKRPVQRNARRRLHRQQSRHDPSSLHERAMEGRRRRASNACLRPQAERGASRGRSDPSLPLEQAMLRR